MTFVDTGAWIALSDRKDQNHGAALGVYGRLKQQRERLVTTDYVVDETITRFRYDLSHSAASQFIDLIEQVERTGVLNLIGIGGSLWQEAKAIFRQYDIVVLSFTDCTSFAVCQKHKISQVFAYDQHFAMMGLTLLS
ncbi:type II toxin-antitoxin system VapC family toxin [candidate division KSB1 bacterium]|nr:type II toxin-antitoxin system VapC family toxin [candidate division KSB1 bacterium]